MIRVTARSIAGVIAGSLTTLAVLGALTVAVVIPGHTATAGPRHPPAHRIRPRLNVCSPSAISRLTYVS